MGKTRTSAGKSKAPLAELRRQTRSATKKKRGISGESSSSGQEASSSAVMSKQACNENSDQSVPSTMKVPCPASTKLQSNSKGSDSVVTSEREGSGVREKGNEGHVEGSPITTGKEANSTQVRVGQMKPPAATQATPSNYVPTGEPYQIPGNSGQQEPVDIIVDEKDSNKSTGITSDDKDKLLDRDPQEAQEVTQAAKDNVTLRAQKVISPLTVVVTHEGKRPSPAMSRALYRIFENIDNFSDINLVTKDGVSIAAHKFMLSCRSPFFRSLLQTETKKEGFNGILQLPNWNAPALRVILKWMYTGDLEEGLEEDCLEEVSEGAVQFKLKELTELLENQMKEELRRLLSE